ncbi:hypothetical protein G7Y79_00042g078490 [Physcia stellaris]|nr:hypothetical protein G7Y79_00042g078490 [Physcia stellaris]
MACQLLELAPELQLKIANTLLSDISANETTDDVDGTYDLNDEGPDEKLERKKRGSCNHRMRDLMRWSCTSRFFRDLFAPHIFHSIRLRNTDRNGSSVVAVAQSQHSRHVKELIYVGNAPGEAHKGEERYSNTKRILPESVSSILSDLGSLPNLQTLSIEFPYQFTVWDEWEDFLGEYEKEETDEKVQAAEETIAWRALMANTWNALLTNRDIKVKSLIIKKLAPIKVSTFDNPAFHSWLGQFESFNLSIYGQVDGAGWRINRNWCYLRMMSRLDGYFFNHLTSVTDLVVKAPSEGPLGLEGINHISLGVYKDQMPALKNLHLDYIFISPELIDFFLGHDKTLESLSMRNCSADLGTSNGIPWYRFFDTLHDANLTKLRNLEILPKNAPLIDESGYRTVEDDENLPAEVKEARRALEDDPARRSFMYTRLEDVWGFLRMVEEENLAAFQSGRDQASYDRLMEKIKINHARL